MTNYTEILKYPDRLEGPRFVFDLQEPDNFAFIYSSVQFNIYQG